MKRKLIMFLLALSTSAALIACGGTKEASAQETTHKETEKVETKAAAVKEAKAEKKEAEEKKEEKAAEKTTSKDVGHYEIYEYTGNGNTVTHEMLVQAGMGDTYLDLRDDGTGELCLFTTVLDITWKEGSVKVYGTTDYTYTLDGDTLILDMAGVQYTMKRSGDAAPAAAKPDSKDDSKDKKDTEETTEAAAETESEKDDNKKTSASADVPNGDGIISEEEVQKGYVWMNKINKDIFNTTYEDLVAYFGVDGEFDKEEYVENMKQNRRYYKWISSEDPNHFIYVNFGEKDPAGAPGVYKITGFNSSGFKSSEAEEKYLSVLEEEASEAGKAAAANAAMKDTTLTLHPFGSSDKTLDVKLQMPDSGWSTSETSGKWKLIENEDPDAFGAGFIKFEMAEEIEKFDFYKDKFENYKEIDDREIGGIKMKGRTYKNIGYEWTEYIGTVSDGKAISVGIVRVDISDGAMGDKILNSITFN
ncbi:hypothetical protein [Oribacterium sp. P6A1]|uniref:hypothetical protein n=1 Tax=Oribacterium sp. P6A1 TaxID=1410612 RepID=UPI00056B7810|nr:hypothetical protein [Oribacterium sp. P6A1]